MLFWPASDTYPDAVLYQSVLCPHQHVSLNAISGNSCQAEQGKIAIPLSMIVSIMMVS